MGNTFIKITMGLTAAVAAISCGTAAVARSGNAYRSKECPNSVECTEVCFTDNDGDGVCDNRGMGNGCVNGPGFADEDNDGVCDNRGTGNGCVNGPGFADEDNDGVCDNRGTGNGCGNGRRVGHHGNGGGRHCQQ